MLSAIITDRASPISIQDMPMPRPETGESLVQIAAAALNHRDVWITKGQYAGITYPCILGSDGAGWSEGSEVILYPGFGWGDNPAVQSKSYRILGMPDHGTFASHIAVSDDLIFSKPAHLSMEEAAALPLAGLTAYRILFSKCAATRQDKILVTGIGGGVAVFVLQFAVAMGAAVWVTSSSDTKIEKAIALGATGGANYSQPDWDKTLQQQSGGFDVIIDGAAGNGFAQLARVCSPGARIGLYGGTQGAITGLSPQIIFYKQLSIFGSTMGTPEEFSSMLRLIEKYRIRPVIDSVFPMEKAPEAFERMEKGIQFGKIVLRNP